jgi:hypothetical protein
MPIIFYLEQDVGFVSLFSCLFKNMLFLNKKYFLNLKIQFVT